MDEIKPSVYGGVVWILSGIALIIYAVLGLTQTAIPGVEEFVDFLSSAQGTYLYGAAFLAIFFEGLYFIGSLLPGTTLVLLVAIVAQAGGTWQFLSIIFTVYLGWLLAGLCNVIGARYFSHLFRGSRQQLKRQLKTIPV